MSWMEARGLGLLPSSSPSSSPLSPLVGLPLVADSSSSSNWVMMMGDTTKPVLLEAGDVLW
jgi:hypothetical protein